MLRINEINTNNGCIWTDSLVEFLNFDQKCCLEPRFLQDWKDDQDCFFFNPSLVPASILNKDWGLRR